MVSAEVGLQLPAALRESHRRRSSGSGNGRGRGRELGPGAATVIRSRRRFGRVAEWQTRWLQVPVSFGTWGFKSPFAHKVRFSSNCEH